MSSSTSLPSFNKLLIRNMRRRYPEKLAHIPDEDIVQRHRYITQVLNTNLTRNPEYLKYMTGWKSLPDDFTGKQNPSDQKNPKSHQ